MSICIVRFAKRKSWFRGNRYHNNNNEIGLYLIFERKYDKILVPLKVKNKMWKWF